MATTGSGDLLLALLSEFCLACPEINGKGGGRRLVSSCMMSRPVASAVVGCTVLRLTMTPIYNNLPQLWNFLTLSLHWQTGTVPLLLVNTCGFHHGHLHLASPLVYERFSEVFPPCISAFSFSSPHAAWHLHSALPLRTQGCSRAGFI